MENIPIQGALSQGILAGLILQTFTDEDYHGCNFDRQDIVAELADCYENIDNQVIHKGDLEESEDSSNDEN